MASMRQMPGVYFVGALIALTAFFASGARIDHVIIGTSDVEEAARVLGNKYGLVSSTPARKNSPLVTSVLVLSNDMNWYYFRW